MVFAGKLVCKDNWRRNRREPSTQFSVSGVVNGSEPRIDIRNTQQPEESRHPGSTRTNHIRIWDGGRCQHFIRLSR